MSSDTLRVGRIDYLNVSPLFHLLDARFGHDKGYSFTPGHPEELNRLLAQGELDISPSSAFEYLRHPGLYHLLPDLSISADGPVMSVHLATPAPLAELAALGQVTVGLTTASASSIALLKILWRHHWRLPEPRWVDIPPGSGPSGSIPFLEIGNLALGQLALGLQSFTIVDLAREWRAFTGLPCVFGVWIARRGLSPAKAARLAALREVLSSFDAGREATLEALYASGAVPAWLDRATYDRYFQAVRYGLGPRETASLILFAAHCSRLGLISAAPALTWQR